MTRSVVILVFAAVVAPTVAIAQETLDQAKDEAAIQDTGEAYVKAFNAKDAKALAAFWSPEAVYTNRLTGEQVVGREAIAQQFANIFETAGDLKLDVSVASVQFVSPNVAVEHGVAKFLSAESEPEAVPYSAVYVRRDGKWLLDRVTDDPKPVVQSHYEQLKDLEWMIGSWVDQDDEAKVVTECSWTRNNNFITRSFTVQIRDRIDMAGMQIIGWDPSAKQIRSWVFDSNGGFGEGTWEKKDNRWYIQRSGVLPDGGKTSSVNMITCVDNDTCTLQSVNRMAGRELLPNIDEVTVVKQYGAKNAPQRKW
jgi:uncharacterized protein (TIGR02246 family)